MTRPDDEQRVVRLRQRWWQWEFLRLPILLLFLGMNGVNGWLATHGESSRRVVLPFPVGPKSALWQPSEQGVWFWAHYHRIGGH